MRILVTSSKGGIGKSTLSAGLALAFAKMGRKVLLCDCDLGGRCLDMFLGEEDNILFDIGDLAAGRTTAANVLSNPWSIPTLFFCPSPAIYDPKDYSDGALAGALKALEAACGADHVICDTAGMVCAPEIAREYADTLLVVSTQQPASVRAAEAAAVLMGAKERMERRLIISNFDPKSAKTGSRAGILEIIDGSGMQCAGIVPHDAELMLAGERGQIPPERSAGMRAFQNIAARLEGNSVKLFDGIPKINLKKLF